MYANKHAYTIDERARFRGPLWHIADEQDYRPIGTYTHHRLVIRKKRMGIDGYRYNQKSRFNLINGYQYNQKPRFRLSGRRT